MEKVDSDDDDVNRTKAQTRNIFTYNSDIGVLDERWVCGDLALVQSFVAPLCELDLQLPVVRLLVDDLQDDDDDDDVDDGTHNSCVKQCIALVKKELSL